jgi:hypothetical protein
VYRVGDEDRQQQILRVLRSIGDSEVVALGTSGERDWFVVLDCATPTAVARVHEWITVLDPSAARWYSTPHAKEIRRVHRSPVQPLPPSTA